MAGWIDFEDFESVNLMDSFLRWGGFCITKKARKGKEGCIWLVTIWSLWIIRNEVIFREED